MNIPDRYDAAPRVRLALLILPDRPALFEVRFPFIVQEPLLQLGHVQADVDVERHHRRRNGEAHALTLLGRGLLRGTIR